MTSTRTNCYQCAVSDLDNFEQGRRELPSTFRLGP
jgi:hypothetical protein